MPSPIQFVFKLVAGAIENAARKNAIREAGARTLGSVRMRCETSFDAGPIYEATDRAAERIFKKFGAYVRVRARSSIRKRKGISAPGSPPSSHTGSLRNMILYAYDMDNKSVVIGPTLGASQSGAPEALEHGGRARMGPSGSVVIGPRPYMGPALEAELPQLPKMWKDSVR